LDITTIIAEKKIAEAMERGEFDDLPGRGAPLKLDDDAGVPAELRVAYKICRNAGVLPPELEARRDLVNLRDLVRRAATPTERDERMRELNYRIMRFELETGRPLAFGFFGEYEDRVVERLTGAGAADKQDRRSG